MRDERPKGKTRLELHDGMIVPVSQAQIEQQKSALLTGYGPIWLRREGDFILVLVEDHGKEWVEVIREHVDGAFSHIIEPRGIEEEMRRKKGDLSD